MQTIDKFNFAGKKAFVRVDFNVPLDAVSYTHLRAHETRHDLVCRLLLEKKKKITYITIRTIKLNIKSLI